MAAIQFNMKKIVPIMFAVGLVFLSTLFTGCQSGPPQAQPGLSAVVFRLLNLDDVALIRTFFGLEKMRHYSVNIVNLGTGRAQAFHVDKENWVSAYLPTGRYLVSSVNNDIDDPLGNSQKLKKLPLRLLFDVGESHKTYYLGEVSLQLKGSPQITKNLDGCKLYLTKTPGSSVLIDNDHNFKIEEE
jgi:hypothetical protein